jgi:hypothetical protein
MEGHCVSLGCLRQVMLLSISLLNRFLYYPYSSTFKASFSVLFSVRIESDMQCNEDDGVAIKSFALSVSMEDRSLRFSWVPPKHDAPFYLLKQNTIKGKSSQ